MAFLDEDRRTRQLHLGAAALPSAKENAGSDSGHITHTCTWGQSQEATLKVPFITDLLQHTVFLSELSSVNSQARLRSPLGLCRLRYFKGLDAKARL